MALLSSPVIRPSTPSGPITPARRTHAVLTEDGCDHRDDDVRPKRTRTECHPLTQSGKAFVIMGDMWRHFQTVIDTGYHGINQYSPNDTLPYTTRKMIALYSLLIKLAPSIPKELEMRGPQGSIEIAQLLEKGRGSQRSSDTYHLKGAIFQWHIFTPSVPEGAKHLRGFNHPEFGRMLCPAGYDWTDPRVKEALKNGSNTYPAGSADWPVFLWENEHVDNNNLHEGFLRSTWVVKALQFILVGPAAARPKAEIADEGSKNNSSTTKSRKQRASVYGLRRITTGAIAYGAVMMHFAFSSQEIFGVGDGPGKFNYGHFHHSLVQEMDEEMEATEREDLLDWYTNLVLGPHDDHCHDENHNGAGRNHTSVASRMRAQRAARKQQANDAEAAAPLGSRNAN